jgi:hypothetical protein
MSTKTMSFVGILSVLVALMTCVAAQSGGSLQSYWHDSDYYAIQLDGIGNAFVSVQMNLQSISSQSVGSIKLDIPYPNVTIYRVIGENGINYMRPCDDGYSSRCGYQYPYYDYGNPEFLNYTTVTSGNMTEMTLFLNTPLTNSSQTRIYFFFSARNVAENDAQGYQFSFRTITDPHALIRNAYANVEVPSDMYLKDKSSFSITYDASAELMALPTMGSASSVISKIDSIFYGPYQYSTTNLLPFEYFTIAGRYGSSLLLLYLPEILFAIAAAAVIFALVIKYSLLSRIIDRFSKAKKKAPVLKKKTGFDLMRTILAGMISGFVFQIAYFGVAFMYSVLNVGSYYYSYNSPLPILLGLLSLIIYVFALFGLPYRLYAKFNKNEGIVAGVISIAASVFFYLVIMLLFPSPIMFAISSIMA